MNFREKLFNQIIVSVFIFCCISCIKAMDNDIAVNIMEKTESILSENYTGEDIKEAAALIKSKTVEAAEKIHQVVSEANSENISEDY